jgi:hypothetical protein
MLLLSDADTGEGDVTGALVVEAAAKGREREGGGAGGITAAGRLLALVLALAGRELPVAVDGRPPCCSAAIDRPPPTLVLAATDPPATAPAEVAGRVLPGPRDMAREVEAPPRVLAVVDKCCWGAEKSMGAEVVSERDIVGLPPSKLVRQIMTMSSPPAVAK